MYEKHFGLKSRPFRSGVDASGIFVGPTQVKIMASLKKALACADAVVSVTGSVGVGKTTVVNRALEGVTSKRVVARVGRMHLAADEVLELLLTEFDVIRQPTGTIQRFGAFKRLLHDWAATGTRAFIVVEDAERIGTDALIELEALTAADSGDSAGASIILMGQSSLYDLLAQPALARMRQRMRLRLSVGPFSAAEIQGYLKHCIRSAGGEFDNIFDPGAVDMLYRCSEGVPRVVNNLCESVFAAAAEANAALVMPQLVQHVAHEEFALQPTLPAWNRRKTDPPANSASAKAPLAAAVKPRLTPTQTLPAAKDASPSAKAATATKPSVNVPAATPAVAPTRTEFEPLPVGKFSPEPDVTRPPEVRKVPDTARTPEPTSAPATPQLDNSPRALPEDDIPELIQDTQPELAALSDKEDLPDLTDMLVPAAPARPAAAVPARTRAAPGLNSAAVSRPAPQTTAKGRSLPTLDDIPTLSGELTVNPRKNGNGENTNASKPAIGPAAATATKHAASSSAGTGDADAEDEDRKEATITELPAWDRDPTLAELRPDIAALEAALAGVPEAPAKPVQKAATKAAVEPAPPMTKTGTGAFDLPEITLEKELKVKEIEAQELLRNAAPIDTLEPDLDPPMKRKHGFDLDRIADELGKARSLEDVDDKLAETLFGEEMAAAAAEIAAMVAKDEAIEKAAKTAVAPPATAANAARPGKPDVPVAKPGNNMPKPAVTEADAAAAGQDLPAVEITLQTQPDPITAAPDGAPEPIEEQFGTSMTASLKALSAAQVKKMDASANDEDEEKSPRRLFGLFRGST